VLHYANQDTVTTMESTTIENFISNDKPPPCPCCRQDFWVAQGSTETIPTTCDTTQETQASAIRPS
jgi:hypothetical protein